MLGRVHDQPALGMQPHRRRVAVLERAVSGVEIPIRAGVARLPTRCAESQPTNGSSEQLARTKAAKIRTVTVLFLTPNCSSKRATSSGGTKPDS